MSKILIFDTEVSGHHLEYLHHLYIMAYDDADNEYYFCVSNRFYQVSTVLYWPVAKHVNIVCLTDKESSVSGNIYKKSWQKARLCRKYVTRYDCDFLFLNTMMDVLPFLPFFLPKNLKCMGIIYKIYLYVWKDNSTKDKLLDLIKYAIFKYASCFYKIFVLNDEISAIYLNKIWRTNKFIYLPDPYISIKEKEIDIRKEYRISDNKRIVLHVGAISLRKGTLNVISLIEKLSEEEKHQLSFVFAGKVNDDIKEVLYQKVSEFQPDVQIVLIDEFCDFNLIGALCKQADLILLPYQETFQSSGIIAYASQYKVPVMMPKKGLIKKLVRRYELGYLYDDLYKSFICWLNSSLSKSQSSYIEEHTIDSFLRVIKNVLVLDFCFTIL